MEIIKHTVTTSTPPLNFTGCLLDIETTGLSPKQHAIFCVGICYLSEGELHIHQLLIDQLEDERKLLEALVTLLEPFTSLYIYSPFDVKFINERLLYHELIAERISHMHLFDFKKVTLFHAITGSKTLNRTCLETLTGYTRHSHLQGKDVIKCYQLFASTHDDIYKQSLLMHNQDELNSLYHLYTLYYCFLQLTPIAIKDFYQTDDAFVLKLDIMISLPEPFSYTVEDLHIAYSNQIISISLPLYQKKLRHYLTPAKDYVYIPSKDQLVHKSFAGFLPREMIQKVSQKDCYLLKDTYCFKLPSATSSSDTALYDEEGVAYRDANSITTARELWQTVAQQIKPKYL